MKIWMIDTTGSPKFVDSHLTSGKQAEGWVLLPSNMVTTDGRPKQAYFPQYDGQKPPEETIMQLHKTASEVLEVEIF